MSYILDKETWKLQNLSLTSGFNCHSMRRARRSQSSAAASQRRSFSETVSWQWTGGATDGKLPFMVSFQTKNADSPMKHGDSLQLTLW